MKRLFLSLGILSIVSQMAFAEVILAPQWSEFCPVNYINAESSKFNSSKTYWYTRRLQFNESIERCNAYTGDDLKSCYSQVRESELSKNKAWNAKVQAERESLNQMIEYNNTQNTFNSINKLIDKIK